ncbi:uncharacterized protein EV154DRAFT_419129 [Mucor mucedo]|uniref:uncharacterized protein n=1 Tax=Mucor mucedo TaxID=29922 RepID=UPI00222061C6|nr:uncharacterized protein EV154DRAFT_419129 [Mucor mucedo]KAI7892116.1 hypothetical protein EV154DRAFT_419129 [Mucor mucedo]
MAAVSFLETTNLVGLGLSADRVFSHVTDLNATKLIEPVKQQGGLKIMSDVVDGSYRVFDGLGKFWQRNTQELENNKTATPVDGPINKFLEMKSVDELTLGEVTVLLADYKRLAAIIKQAGLA